MNKEEQCFGFKVGIKCVTMQDMQDSYFNKCEKVQYHHSMHEFGGPTGVNSLFQLLSSCLAQAT